MWCVAELDKEYIRKMEVSVGFFGPDAARQVLALQLKFCSLEGFDD